MKKKLTGLLAAVLLAGALTGCASSQMAAQKEIDPNAVLEGDFETLTLTMSTNGTDLANDTKAARLFADKIYEKSGGKITVNVFPNDQLAGGNMSKGLELVCGGAVDLDVHSTSIIANLDNRLMVSTLPWLFSDYQAAEDAFYGAGGKFINSILEEKGLYYLGAVHNGFKAMTNSKHPITKPEDLKGLKIRIPGGDFFSAFYTAFGASPQAMSWSEVFTALQQGTIDGHDNSLGTINSANVQEVQKYISISKHTYEAFTFTVNAKRFDAMNEDTQALIRLCVEEATKEMNQQIIADEGALREKFETQSGCEIYEFTTEDMEAFREVVRPLIEKYKAIYGEAACAAFGVA